MRRPVAQRLASARLFGPGIVLALAIGGAASALSSVVPLVGAPILGLVIGLGARAVLRPAATWLSFSASSRPGLRLASRGLLQCALVLLGATISLGEIGHVGRKTLPVMLGTLAAALIMAVLAGHALGVSPRMRLLIGVGTGICGASAVAAVSAVLDASELETAYALSTVFTFNFVALLAFPPIGHALALSPAAFGLWAGTAINDTSSVVAAAFSYGHTAGAYAVIVKLTRTTMIIPVAFALWARTRRRQARAKVGWRKIVPWFLAWFAVAAALRTFGAVPASLQQPITEAAITLLAAALAAIGMLMNLREVRRTGGNPFFLGLVIWLVVALTSLAIQRGLGTW